ncbi:hypothetical protein INT47_005189 [Mucor saturninus]|uniref:WD40 repeat-like protein n=1 Tax=Mucor saturninus TaxID=64648 RepID=A0A8H7QVQ2_9FUNG|nr:hypothetical protein INT47_005189 [Mucor saturninus]
MSIKSITPLFDLKGHEASVLAVEYAKTSLLGEHILASGSEDNTCRLWDIRSQQAVRKISLSEPVTSIKFGKKSGSSSLYLSSGTKVHTFDLRSEGASFAQPIQTYEFSNDEINSIDVNENNKYLATADDDGVVNVIDLGSHKIHKKSSKKHNNICMSVSFRAKKSWEVWSGGMDSKLYEWDFSRGLPTNIYDMNSKEPTTAQMFNPPFVYKVATSPDGEWIAASLGDSTIQLLSPPNKKQKRFELKEIRLSDGHNSMVNCLSFLTGTKNELNLISGAANGRVAIWNPSSKTPIQQMYKLDDAIGKVNDLEAYMFGDHVQIAVAGTGESGDLGALKVYHLQ